MSDLTMRRLRLRVWIAQVSDLVTFAAFFVIIGGASIHVERNPIIGAAYALAGLAGVSILKMGLVTVAMRHRPPVARLPGWKGALSRPITHGWYWSLYTIILSVAAASGIAGAGFNAASLISSLR